MPKEKINSEEFVKSLEFVLSQIGRMLRASRDNAQVAEEISAIVEKGDASKQYSTKKEKKVEVKEEPAPVPAAKEEPKSVEELTEEELVENIKKACMQGLMDLANLDRKLATSVLDKFGCKAFSQLDAKKYPEFLQEIKAAQ